MVPVDFLLKIGFQFTDDLKTAKLQVAENTFLHLQRYGIHWSLGHSVDGEKVVYRPGGNTPCQLVREIDELFFEIAWLRLKGAQAAICISKALQQQWVENLI